jgi:hypothetical protein
MVDIELKYLSKFSLNVLFLGIKFDKNLRFSLGEYCE